MHYCCFADGIGKSNFPVIAKVAFPTRFVKKLSGAWQEALNLNSPYEMVAKAMLC